MLTQHALRAATLFYLALVLYTLLGAPLPIHPYYRVDLMVGVVLLAASACLCLLVLTALNHALQRFTVQPTPRHIAGALAILFHAISYPPIYQITPSIAPYVP